MHDSFGNYVEISMSVGDQDVLSSSRHNENYLSIYDIPYFFIISIISLFQ